MPLSKQEHQQAIIDQIWRLRAKFPVYAYEKYRMQLMQERGKDFPIGSYESTIHESMSARFSEGWIASEFAYIINALDALEKEHQYTCRETYQAFVTRYHERMKTATSEAQKEEAWRDAVSSIHLMQLTEAAADIGRINKKSADSGSLHTKKSYWHYTRASAETPTRMKAMFAFTLLGFGILFLTLAIKWRLEPVDIPLPENITAPRHRDPNTFPDTGSGKLLPDKALNPAEMEEERKAKEKLKSEVPLIPLTASPEPNRFRDLHGTGSIVLAANKLAKRGIIDGYPDGTFQPKNSIIRAEIVKILVRARFGWQVSNAVSTLFTDVRPDDWFNQYMDTAAKYDIVNTRNGTLFYPAKDVNTAEFISMVGVAFDLPANEPYPYKDVDPRRGFARYAGAVSKMKLLPRHPELLEPARPVTRGEAAQAIYMLLLNNRSTNGQDTSSGGVVSATSVQQR